MKNLFIFLGLILLPIALIAQTDDSKPIIFITDASGSMWQKVDNEYKIVIAKEVLRDLVAEMDASQPVGLVAYGHRSKSDCSDIEELVPAENLDRGLFQNQLEGLNPTGKTPLALSVKSVIDRLKSKNIQATIILITDGIETCKGNLCDLVKEAKEAGIEFVLHVVGFDLKGEDRTLLECAAGEGGGLYIDASDKDQLSVALQETSEITVDVPPGRLAAKCIKDGELVDTKVTVFLAGTDEDIDIKRSYSSERKNPIIFRIPAGTYDVEAELIAARGVASLRQSNVVVTDSLHEVLFDFSSGRFELKVTNMGEPHDATVNVISLLTGKNVERGRTYTGPNHNPMRKELSPGFYNFIVKSVTINGDMVTHTFDNVEVKAGEVVKLIHNFETAVLKVGASYNGQLSDATVHILSMVSNKAAASGRTYTSDRSNPKSFLLSPGKYKVDVKPLKVEGNPIRSFEIELKPGDLVEKMVEY